jgi:hypothetical protein
VRRPRLVPVVLACLIATIGVSVRAQAAGDTQALSAQAGTLRLNGKAFFPILTWAQCAADVPENLAVGVTVFMGDSCDDTAALAAAIGGRAYLVPSVALRGDQPTATLPRVIGWHQPDEPDANGVDAAALPAPEPLSGRLTFLTVTAHFAKDQRWLTTQHPAAWWRAYAQRADVLGFDLYPLSHLCRQSKLGIRSVFDEQRDLVRLAAGRPTFQWIEASAIDGTCGADPVSPAALRAEVFLAIAGGANGIGYFTHAWADGPWVRFAVSDALRAAMTATDADLQALATVLQGPDGARFVRGKGGILVGARRAGRHLLVVAVNPRATTVRGRVDFRRYAAGSVVAWNEQRTLRLVRGGFADAFAPLQVHLYDVAPGQR